MTIADRKDPRDAATTSGGPAGFARVSGSVVVAAVLGGISMLLYPGGTALDHSTSRYSLTHNFLSDLGMTVAYNGQSNTAGAVLFVLSLVVLVFGLVTSLPLMLRLAESGRARKWGFGAAAAGGLACAAFLGVAITPENRWMTLHVQLTIAAFRLLPVATFALMLASLSTHSAHRRMARGWGALTTILAAYAAFLQWGPPPTTNSGLQLSAVAQKLVTVTVVLLMTYQIFHAGVAFNALRTRRG